MRFPRVLYGWAVPGGVCLSHLPPDVAQLPRDVFADVADAEQYMASINADRRRPVTVVWSGPALAEKRRLDAAAALIAENEQRTWSRSR